MKKIGFIGVGIMGSGMVRNLLKNGFDVNIFARDRKKVLASEADGAVFCDTIANCVRDRDAVITIVGFPRDVEEVYFSPGGILESAGAGTYLIDMTTSSPQLSERIYAAGEGIGCPVLDAPVTGGDVGARDGTLSILAGGREEDYEACLPVFRAMGTKVNYFGGAGCGQRAKMANQILIAGALTGVCEGIAYAKARGLDLMKLLDAVSTGAAGSRQLDLLGKKMIEGDMAPGFLMKHFVKDLTIAEEDAGAGGLQLDLLRLVRQQCTRLVEAGYGDSGTQAEYLYYTDPAGRTD